MKGSFRPVTLGKDEWNDFAQWDHRTQPEQPGQPRQEG